MKSKIDQEELIYSINVSIKKTTDLINKIKYMEREINPIKDFLKNNKDTLILMDVRGSVVGIRDFSCAASKTIVYPMLQNILKAYRRKKRLLEEELENLVTLKE